MSPLLEVPGGERREAAQHSLSRFLREVMVVGQFCGEMLQREGSLHHSLGSYRLRRSVAFLAAGAAFFAGGITISLGLFAWARLLGRCGSERARVPPSGYRVESEAAARYTDPATNLRRPSRTCDMTVANTYRWQ